MDISKQPGIVFQGVYLTRLQFSLLERPQGELEYGLDLQVSRVIQELEGGAKRLLLTLDADPMKHVKKKPFDLKVSLVGKFEAGPNSNLPIEEFAKTQAPALLVPYLRELISDITSRCGLPPLMLPPINVHAVLAASEAKKTLPASEDKKALSASADK